MRTALLLIAHGSRNAEANADLYHLAQALSSEFAAVEPSFLELAAPTIDDGAAACVLHRVERVVMVPYFLSAGVHVRRDLALARDRLAARHPDTSFVLAEPLGRHPLLVDVVRERVKEAEADLEA